MKTKPFPHAYIYCALAFLCLMLAACSYLLYQDEQAIGRKYSKAYTDWILATIRLQSYVERVDEKNALLARYSFQEGDTAQALALCKDVCFRARAPFCDTLLAGFPAGVLAEVWGDSRGVHEAVCASFTPAREEP